MPDVFDRFVAGNNFVANYIHQPVDGAAGMQALQPPAGGETGKEETVAGENDQLHLGTRRSTPVPVEPLFGLSMSK